METLTPHQHNLRLMAETPPSLRFRGGEPFEDWQNRARDTLRELLGMDRFSPCDLQFSAEPSVAWHGGRRTRFTFQSEMGYTVPGYWCVPADAGPWPVMICLQGHSTGMHISMGEEKFPGDAAEVGDGDRDYAKQALDRGFAALVLEQRNFGECGGTPKGPDCYRSAMAALLLGRTTLGERVWDVSRAIDVLEMNFQEADQSRIFCMGNSGGGTATFYATCLEPRIRGAMPSCSICSFDASIAPIHHCACNHVPHIRRFFDMGDLAGLIAPRPLTVVAGEQDGIFPIGATRETFALIQDYYAAAGRPDRCQLIVGSGGHRFYAEPGWTSFLKLTQEIR
ncbi:MAG: acetylxylan esterase [Oscillospiraceae bacterium]|jgi:dienelactone hydrolase|nr:acetylxylan esterase [Oscillospiraceae bacterium]